MDFVNDLKKSGLYVIGHVRKGELDASEVVDPLHQVIIITNFHSCKVDLH